MVLAMSALLSEAGIPAGLQDICYVPQADIAAKAALLNHFVRQDKDSRRDGQPQRSSRFEVDDQLKLGG
jgi:hypothetical protein